MRVLDPILRQLLRAPLRTFIIDDFRRWNGLQLYVAATRLAREIARTTDRPNVGILLPTSGLYPLAVLAAWMLGRTIVPINYLLEEEDRQHVYNDAEIDTLITVGPMLEHFGRPPASLRLILLENCRLKGLPWLRRRVRRPDDHLAAILYTSGTSARPKGVMLTSANLAANVEQCIQWAGFDPDNVFLGVLPQFHSFGLTVLTLLPLARGCRVIYSARFVPSVILNLLIQHRPTALIAIPSMFQALLSAKGATPDHFSSLNYAVSGAEPLPDSVYEGYRDRMKLVLNEGYGLTEASPVSHWCRPGEDREGSVGRILPGMEQKIVSLDGKRLSPWQPGEICLRGPNIMQGYYKLPEETAAAFDTEGYLKTGDIGYLDEDGYLYITGRLKEMLIVAGENVFPRDIEEVLNRHPAVLDSAVIGVPDRFRGETALAFVELQEGVSFDEAEIRAYCQEHLMRHKVPREIRPLQRLPRTATGKVQRRHLHPDLDPWGAPG